MPHFSNQPTAADRFSVYAQSIFVLGVYLYATPLIVLCCALSFIPVLVFSLVTREHFFDLFAGVLEWTLHPPNAERPVYGLMAAAWAFLGLMGLLYYMRM